MPGTIRFYCVGDNLKTAQNDDFFDNPLIRAAPIYSSFFFSNRFQIVTEVTSSFSVKSLPVFLRFTSTIACKTSLSTTVLGLPGSSLVRLSSLVSNFWYQRRMVRSFTELFSNVALMFWVSTAALWLLFYSY